MPAIIRNTGPRGPRFYDDEGKLMFVNVVDASTRDGPREATEVDMKAFPEAVEAFTAGAPSFFPGAEPIVKFSDPKVGRPPDFDPERLAKAPPPREEPKETKAKQGAA